jgi:hypothetical protein
MLDFMRFRYSGAPILHYSRNDTLCLRRHQVYMDTHPKSKHFERVRRGAETLRVATDPATRETRVAVFDVSGRRLLPGRRKAGHRSAQGLAARQRPAYRRHTAILRGKTLSPLSRHGRGWPKRRV